MLIGAICDGETRITGFGRSADTEATIAAVRALGVEVYEHGAETLRVFGKGLGGLAAPGVAIDCANAGTLVRLLAGILAGQVGEEFELTGDASLSQRPMGRIAEPLARMGAGIETTDGRLPLGIEGRALQAIDYALPVASAQVKSAILLAGLYADGETTVVEPAPTRDHTERMLAAAGALGDRPADERHGPAGRAALARRDRGARRLLVGRAVRRRGHARPRLGAPRPRRQPQSPPHGPARRSSSAWGRGSRSTTAG